MRQTAYILSALTMFSSLPTAAAAQDAEIDLMSLDRGTLRSEIESRYAAALAATNDDGYISADDPRFMWASEAKVQCAIAIGYLKSRTRDETSISKCNDAYNRMTRQRVVAALPIPPAAPRPPLCDSVQPGIVFFDWDSDVPEMTAIDNVRIVAENADNCGWRSFGVTGHTDRSGSDAYNDGLSMRRAQSVANLMESLGIERSQMTIRAEGEDNPRVPTEDGIRNPQNRRVEITVSR